MSNTTLKGNDELINKLIMLVRGDGLSIAAAARSLGVGVRSAQEMFAGDKKWAKQWWAQNEEDVDAYFAGLKGIVLPQYTTEDATEEDKELYRIYKKTMSDLHSNTQSGIFTFDFTPEVEEDNSRILLISDMHIPYHHKDTLAFLQHLKDKHNPTRVICLGDELDKHALSFHDSDPDLPSAGDELRLALPAIAKLKEMFPVMDILESNHGSLVYRKAHAHGIPRHYLKSYNDVLGVDDNWKWHYDLTIELPNGNKCYFHHGKSANVSKTSQTMSMCAVQGHYHETFKVEYWGNPNGLYWGLQAGCLINDKAYAFNYNNCNLKRPIIGTAMIIDSIPVLEPLIMNELGDWIGK